MKWHKCQRFGLKPIVFGLKTNFERQTDVKREGSASAHTAKEEIPWVIRNQGISRYPKGRPLRMENLIRGYYPGYEPGEPPDCSTPPPHDQSLCRWEYRYNPRFPVQQKASLAIDRASEALSLCPAAKWENGTCPYIPTYFLACLPFLRRERTATAAAAAATAAIAPAMPSRLSPVLATPETAAFTKETGSSAAAGPSGSW